jgi:tetratricopeptide (TPR) repeat protein
MTICRAALQACKTGRPKGLHYICALAVLFATAAFAQDAGREGAPAPPAPRNLQVLPKGSSQQDVLALMQQFTRALGVPCTYCHIEQTAPLLTVEEQQAAQAAAAANPQQAGRGRGRGRGRGGPQMDFASDDRRQKQIARAMLAMTNDLNAKIDAAVHAKAAAGQPREVVHVQCMTCHRGVTNPEQLSNLLRHTMLGKGEGAAVAQYRELRQRYLDTGAYDFREPVLLDLGRESLATHKPDDALAWLQLNVEFFPQSAASYVELAKAHIVKRDRDSAVADLTRALAIDPANADVKRQLRALGK